MRLKELYQSNVLSHEIPAFVLIMAVWATLAWPDHRSAIAGAQLIVALLALLLQPTRSGRVFGGSDVTVSLLLASLPLLQIDNSITTGIGALGFVLIVALALRAVWLTRTHERPVGVAADRPNEAFLDQLG